MKSRPRDIKEALCFLGFAGLLEHGLQRAQTFEEARAVAERIKEAAKERGKRLALIHHPDVGGDENEMKKINAAVAAIQDLQIVPIIPRPVVMRPMIRVVYSHGGGFSTSSTGTTTTTSTVWPF